MPSYDDSIRNAQLDEITARAGNGAKLRAYDGAQPSKNGPATTLLAEWTLGSPFAPAASGGVLSPTLPADTTGIATGYCTWLRVVQSDGSTFVMDIRSSELSMGSGLITTGQPAKILGWTITAGNA